MRHFTQWDVEEAQDHAAAGGQALPGEEWRPVRGWEGEYAVSNLARVMRLRPARGTAAGRILRANRPNGWGYVEVTLSRGGRRFCRLLHVIVAEAFHGPMPALGMEVDHKDGDKGNNAASNLEWVTKPENARRAYQLGLKERVSMPGEGNPNAKYSRDVVDEVLALKGKMSQRAIAAKVGMSRSNVGLIHRGEAWAV